VRVQVPPWLLAREKGTGTFCAKHPKGRSGKRCLSPFLRATCPGGETDIIARFERAVPGSSPGQGAGNEKGVRPHLPERPFGCFAQMGSDPFFVARYPWSVAEARRPAKAEVMQVRLLPGILRRRQVRNLPPQQTRVHDVTWQPATLPWWMRGFKSPWTLSRQDVGKLGNPPAWGAGDRRFKTDHPDSVDAL
jgi:hypothetical protein